MTHKQILGKLSSKTLIESIEEDLARLMFSAMCEFKDGPPKNILKYVLPKLLVRWNCALYATENVSSTYKQKAWLALAVLLHKYGLADAAITKNAINAIDDLNKEVVLSDSFERKSDEIKKLLLSEPKSLKRKPSTPDSITLYRRNEVISFQMDGKYFAAFIHEISDNSAAPIIEVNDVIFEEIPTAEQLKGLKGRGQKYKDGSERVSFFRIAGMKHIPDPANQIHIIGSSLNEKPITNHLEEAISAYAMSDLFRLQEIIKRMFSMD